MATLDDLPFKLGVERAHNLTGRGTLIMGRFFQGTISRDTELELVARDDAGNVRRTRLECVDYSEMRLGPAAKLIAALNRGNQGRATFLAK